MTSIGSFQLGVLRLLIYIYLVEWSSGLNCPSGLHAFPPDSCVSLSEGKRSNCDGSGTDGLAVMTESQLGSTGVLGHYAAAVLADDQLMWLGYRYRSSDVLATDGPGASVVVTGSVLNNASYFDLTVSESPSDTVCLAVNPVGKFVRRQCTEALYLSLCQKKYQMPTAQLLPGEGGVSEGGSLTLTCSTTTAGASISWLFASIYNASSRPMPVFTGNPYLISSFSEARDGGWYFCVVANSRGAVVSTPRLMRSSGNFSTGDPLPAVIMPSPRPEIYNAPVSYTCSYNSISSGNTFWFMNGTPVSGVGGVLDGGVVRHSSFYQCYVLLLESQQVFYGERTVVPQPGVAGLVDQLSVQAQSSSALSVQWLCPEAVGTFDPILLHYRVQYGSSSSSSSSDEVIVRASESTTNIGNCMVVISVPGLEEGTSYSIKVRAMAGGNPGQQPVMVAESATFGQAPGDVHNFQVFMEDKDKTIQAKWDKVVTTPPMGAVEVYYIEYRRFGKKSVSSIRNLADQTSVVISNVIPTDSYELRVRAGVLSGNSPPSYSYGPFTEWKRVGQARATSQPLAGGDSSRVVAIVVGTVMGSVAIIITLVLLGVGVGCFKAKGRRGVLHMRYKRGQSQTRALTEYDGDEEL